MKVGRSKRVLGHHPSRREDDKVARRHARLGGGARQHGKDRRVQVVHRHAVDADKVRQVVLERRVVAVPRHDVKRRVLHLRLEELADKLELLDKRRLAALEAGNWRAKVARVGEAVGADRAEVGQAKVAVEHFAHVAARGPAHSNRENHATLHKKKITTSSQKETISLLYLNDTNFTRRNVQFAKFSGNIQSTLLRN